MCVLRSSTKGKENSPARTFNTLISRDSQCIHTDLKTFKDQGLWRRIHMCVNPFDVNKFRYQNCTITWLNVLNKHGSRSHLNLVPYRGRAGSSSQCQYALVFKSIDRYAISWSHEYLYLPTPMYILETRAWSDTGYKSCWKSSEKKGKSLIFIYQKILD